MRGVYVGNIYATTQGWIVVVFIHGPAYLERVAPFIYWHSLHHWLSEHLCHNLGEDVVALD